LELQFLSIKIVFKRGIVLQYNRFVIGIDINALKKKAVFTDKIILYVILFRADLYCTMKINFRVLKKKKQKYLFDVR
jgi:hypothetical protein